jgi:hypothetical protein
MGHSHLLWDLPEAAHKSRCMGILPLLARKMISCAFLILVLLLVSLLCRPYLANLEKNHSRPHDSNFVATAPAKVIGPDTVQCTSPASGGMYGFVPFYVTTTSACPYPYVINYSSDCIYVRIGIFDVIYWYATRIKYYRV